MPDCISSQFHLKPQCISVPSQAEACLAPAGSKEYPAGIQPSETVVGRSGNAPCFDYFSLN